MLPKNCFLAAIDLGSNSFRLEIDHYSKGKVFRKDYLREPIRLGVGLDEQNALTRDAMERGWVCLQMFKEHLDEMNIHRIRAVATQTLRVATNRDAFIKRGRKILGCPIEVISGKEEALLIYTGVTAILDRKEKEPNDEKRLVIDIGGRSTELVIGQAMQPMAAQSCPIGSVSLSLDYFRDGLLTEDRFKQAITKVRQEFEQSAIQMRLSMGSALTWDKAYGSSGTTGAISSILKSFEITDGRITRDATWWIYEQLLKAGSIQELNMPKLGDRQDVIGGGVAIMMALFECFENLKELCPARGALRQGIIYDMIARVSE